MINLAGLLFRVQVDSDRSQFVMIPKMLKDLVPADQIKMMSPEEWKKVGLGTSTKSSMYIMYMHALVFVLLIARPLSCTTSVISSLS
uniref:Uncharacterized protein n=1 Tax=Periophthalmus magnuspinnatus TaxID=409849 RepID=A0A3B4B5X7_9GOBI